MGFIEIGQIKTPPYRSAYLDDLNTFEKAGIIPPARAKDVVAVREVLAGK